MNDKLMNVWNYAIQEWTKIVQPILEEEDENEYITITLPDDKEISLCFKPTEDGKWQCIMEDETMQDIQSKLNE